MGLRQRAERLLAAKTARDMGVYLLGNIAAAAVNLALLPIITRVLSPEGYGLYAMAIVISGFLFPFASLGLSNVLVRRFVDKETHDFPRLTTTTMAVSVGAFLIVVAAMLVVQALAPDTMRRLTGGLSERLLPFVHVMVAGQVLLTIGLGLLQMEGRPFEYSLVRIAHAAGFGLVGITAVLALGGGAEGLIISKAIVDLAVVIGFTVWMFTRGYLVPRVSSDDTKQVLAYGLPLVPHLISVGLMGMIDRALLTTMVGVGAAGIYMVGYQIGLIMWMVVNSMNQAWLPWFNRTMAADTDEARGRVVRATYALSLALALAAIAFAAFSPLLVRILAGPQFAEASGIAPWIVIAFFFQGLYTLSNCYLYFAGSTGWLSAATLVAVAGNLLFSWLFIRLNGTVGAAQGAAAGYLLSFILVALAAARITPMPWRSALAVRR